ncbi:MAG: hypothetical protein M3Z29_12585 [Pseudomonadota bacterium]|nr:hypothetical protein [Pseudomonadota bacterium]
MRTDNRNRASRSRSVLAAFAAVTACMFGSGLVLARDAQTPSSMAQGAQKKSAGKRAIIFVGGKKQRSNRAGQEANAPARIAPGGKATKKRVAPATTRLIPPGPPN